MSQTVNIEEARELTLDIMKAGLTPMASSSPGVGKSDYLASIAKELKLKLIDVRLSQADNVDLNGFPYIDKEANVSRYIPFDTFPIESTPIPKGYNGWLIFLDELTSAPQLVQAAAYKLILDKMVGQQKLHKNAYTVAAGNLMTDKAIVNRMSTAMQSRLIHLNIEVSVPVWLKWAAKNKVDYRIISFINFRPDLLHDFNPNHNDVTFPCPRTWDFLSRIINKWQTISDDKLPLICGTVSEGAGMEFKGFIDVMASLPSKDAILNDPDSVSIPVDNPSVLYAYTGLVANIIDDSNINVLLRFVDRLPMEFQVITIRQIMAAKIEYENHVDIRAWKIKNIDKF